MTTVAEPQMDTPPHRAAREPRRSATIIDLAFGTARPLVTYAVPAALCAVVAFVGGIWIAPNPWFAIINGTVTPQRAPLWWLVAWVSIALLGNGFALTATMRVVLSRAMGTNESTLQAWRAAIRAPVAIALAAFIPMLVYLLPVVALGFAFPITRVGGVIVAIGFLVAYIALARQLVRWPALVARCPLPAMDDPLTRSGARLLIIWVMTCVVGMYVVVDRIGAEFAPSASVSFARVAAKSLILGSGALLLTATLALIWIVHTAPPDTAPPPRRGTRWSGATLGTVMLLIPALGNFGFTVNHPRAVATVAVAPNDELFNDVEAIPLDGDILALTTFRGYLTTPHICNQTSCSELPDLHGIAWGAAARDDGSVFLVQFDARNYDFALSTYVATRNDLLTLRDRNNAGTTALDSTRRTTVATYSLAAEGTGQQLTDRNTARFVRVEATMANGLPIIAVSLAGEVLDAKATDGSLHVYFCRDARCEASDEVVTPLGDVDPTAAVRVAAAPDGSALVTIGAQSSLMPAVQAIHVTPDGTVTRNIIEPPAGISNRDSASDFYAESSAPAVFGADGLPRLLYRVGTAAQIIYARCLDVSCTSVERATIPTPGAKLTSPSFLLVDDRPLIASYNDDTLAVISCVDPVCSVAERFPIANATPFDDGPFPPVATIVASGDGRPVIVATTVISGVADEYLDTPQSGVAESSVVTCSEARCGAP